MSGHNPLNVDQVPSIFETSFDCDEIQSQYFILIRPPEMFRLEPLQAINYRSLI